MSESRKPTASSVKGVTRTPAGTWRVQKPSFKGARSSSDMIRASFDTLDEAERWALACDQARREGVPLPDPKKYRAAAAAAGRIVFDELAKDFFEARASDLDDNDTVENYRKIYRLRIAPVFGHVYVDVPRQKDVRKFRDKMRGEGLAVSTQQSALSLLSKMFDGAMELDGNKRVVNPVKGVKPLEPDNPLKPADDTDPEPISLAQMKAIAAALAPELRLAVWLLGLAALRISEAFGLRIGHWVPATRRLSISEQGGRYFRTPNGRSRSKGKVKTLASKDWLILPKALADEIDAYIEENHGTAPGPSDAEAYEQWLQRPLLVGIQTRTPGSDGWRTMFNTARDAVGLGRDVIGFRVVPHFLRKTCLSKLLTHPNVTGAAQSRYARHKVNRPIDGQAAMTAKKYTLVTLEQMQACADALDEFIADEIGDLVIPGRPAVDDHYTVAEAAAALGVANQTIRTLLSRGQLWPAGPEAKDAWRGFPGATADLMLIPREAVNAELHRRQRQAETETVSCAEAARLLGAPAAWVREALRAEKVAAQKTDSGHLWQIGPEALDTLSHLWEERRPPVVGGRAPVAGMVTTADAAEILGIRRRRVQLLVADGHLQGGTDQPGHGNRLWIRRDSISAYQQIIDAHAAPAKAPDPDGPAITVDEAAALIGVSKVRMRQLIESGQVATHRDSTDATLLVNTNAAMRERTRRLDRAQRVAPKPVPPGMLTAAQTGALLHRSEQTLKRLASKGTFPAVKINGRWFFNEQSVGDFATAIEQAVPLRQAAAALGMNPNTVSGLAHRGRLQLVLDPGGRTYGVTRESLDAYLALAGSAPLRSQQAATRLGVTPRQLRQLAVHGHIATTHLPARKMIFNAADVERLATLPNRDVVQMAAGIPQGWLSSREVGDRLQTTVRQLYCQHESGKLRGIVRGGTLYFTPAAVERYIANTRRSEGSELPGATP